MKTVVLGGYGVFGSRLAELLVRDGHEVTVVGRNAEKAQATANRIGARPLAADIRTTPEKVFESFPDIVIDAAGPFQSYDTDPYAVPRLCLKHAADYLDLSDDAGFTAGITALNSAAKQHGMRIISGVSSVPGLSSSVVAHLAQDMDDILLIDIAILPGNRAPRGTSVIMSIVSQLGRPLKLLRGGIWRTHICWTDRQRIELAPGMVRSAYMIGVPDIHLFPDFFKAHSVVFRAGLELPLLNWSLRALSYLRQIWPFEATHGRARLIKWLADLFKPLGTDRGGMRVAVTGKTGGNILRREWRLIAEAGDGPFVPAVTARALIRRIESLAPGARPCLAEVPHTAIEDAMSDLSVSTTVEEKTPLTLFQTALADRWSKLPPEVQALHSVQDVESFSGTADITRGTSLIARFAAWFFGFPPAGTNVPVTVTKTRTDKGEIWERNFNGRIFRSFCSPARMPYRYRERFWLFNYEQDLPVENETMQLPVRRGWFLGIPLPKICLPGSDSREFVRNGAFNFDVSLSAPLNGGLIVRYRGRLTPDRDALQTRQETPS